MPDWIAWEERVKCAGDQIDDVVDELISVVLSLPPDPSATGCLILALASARSALSRVDTATAIVWSAADDNVSAVECLEQAFEREKSESFLGPSFLGGLSILGFRNDHARTGAKRFLLRLLETDSVPLLIAGAKAIGLLCDRDDDKALRAKLEKLAEVQYAAVRAECNQQLALLAFGDALLSSETAELSERLQVARTAFATAEAAEEVRPDAYISGLLLDVVLQFDALENGRQAAAGLTAELSGRLRASVTGLGETVFEGNNSTAAVQFARNAYIIASALETAAKEVSNSVRWTCFDTSLPSLARCYAAIRFRPAAFPGHERLTTAMSSVADRVLGPRLGPVLNRKVGKESFAQVIANYRHLNGEDAVLTALHALQEAEGAAERENGSRLSEEMHGKLAALATRLNRSPDALVDDIVVSMQTSGGAAEWAVNFGLLPLSSLATQKEGREMSLPRVGLITVLPEEYDAVRVMLKNEKRHRTTGVGSGHEYMLGEIPSRRGGSHQVVLAQTMRMGNTSAALRASKMLADFPAVDRIIMCGIAGGVPQPESVEDHVRLGDIVVSDGQGVIQYDFGKQTLATFDDRHAPRPPSASLLEAVQILEQDRLAGKRPWDEYLREGAALRNNTKPAEATDVVLGKAGDPVPHPPYSSPRPRIFRGPVASANCVQADYRKRDELRELHRIKAVEMEGSGIADASWEYEKAGYLIVRGICDYCDSRNKATQTDVWKPYVAMAAAAYVRALLEMIPAE